eukprot:IDg15316t1
MCPTRCPSRYGVAWRRRADRRDESRARRALSYRPGVARRAHNSFGANGGSAASGGRERRGVQAVGSAVRMCWAGEPGASAAIRSRSAHGVSVLCSGARCNMGCVDGYHLTCKRRARIGTALDAFILSCTCFVRFFPLSYLYMIAARAHNLEIAQSSSLNRQTCCRRGRALVYSGRAPNDAPLLAQVPKVRRS